MKHIIILLLLPVSAIGQSGYVKHEYEDRDSIKSIEKGASLMKDGKYLYHVIKRSDTCWIDGIDIAPFLKYKCRYIIANGDVFELSPAKTKVYWDDLFSRGSWGWVDSTLAPKKHSNVKWRQIKSIKYKQRKP